MATVTNNRPTGKLDPQGQLAQDSFLDEAFLGDYLSGTNLIYKGYARVGSLTSAPVWQIAFITYDGNNNVLSIQWPQNASGNATNDYEFIWANRASYTYS